MIIVTICLILFSSNLISEGLTVDSNEFRLKHGGEALSALRKLLNFFESDAKNLNADGLYGLRIAQGQLTALGQNLNDKDRRRFTDKHHLLNSLLTQIERIANESLIVIEETNPAYLRRFLKMVSRPFIIDYEIRSIDKTLFEKETRISDFDEDASDQCFGELLGADDQTNGQSCLITKSCWDMMTASQVKDYRLTHQLLWFLVAKNIGCLENRTVSIKANEKFQRLENIFCANIYQDVVSNSKNNENQDLFLEQILLCAMIGYEEFLRLDWLRIILKWQDPVYGCYSDVSDSISFKAKRHLLIEQEMNHACLSHKSGLAAGVLSVYSRVFLE